MTKKETHRPEQIIDILHKVEKAAKPGSGQPRERAGPEGAVLPKTAEIEWSVLARQALKGRLADIAAVEARVDPWQTERNQRRATVNWCFSTTHARTKLARLYPS